MVTTCGQHATNFDENAPMHAVSSRHVDLLAETSPILNVVNFCIWLMKKQNHMYLTVNESEQTG